MPKLNGKIFNFKVLLKIYLPTNILPWYELYAVITWKGKMHNLHENIQQKGKAIPVTGCEGT
jgi:hypothetical protein